MTAMTAKFILSELL